MIKIKFKNKILIVVIICLVWLILHYAGLSRFTDRYVGNIFNPINRVGFGVADSVGDWFSFYFTKHDYKQENGELRKKLIKMARKNIELEILKQENKVLRGELEFVEEFEYKYVTARVLGKGINYENSDILIDKGSKDGIVEGLAVTANQGVMIGKIFKVEDSVSHVRLLTDNMSKLAVFVISEEGSSLGLGHGEHNINIKIDMLSKEAVISEGDLVATSGLEKDIPAGLLVGSIKTILREEEKIWQEAVVEPMVRYGEVRIVTVILGS